MEYVFNILELVLFVVDTADYIMLGLVLMEFTVIWPDKRWVELSVNKHHHLKGHGDAQPPDTGHHHLKPRHTCKKRGGDMALTINIETTQDVIAWQIWSLMSLSVISLSSHCQEWRRWWSRRLQLRCWRWQREDVCRCARWWWGWGGQQGTPPGRRWWSRHRRFLPECPASWSNPGIRQHWWTWKRQRERRHRWSGFTSCVRCLEIVSVAKNN